MYAAIPRRKYAVPGITLDYLKANFTQLHTSCWFGYCSRKKGGYALSYEGLYGRGYRWISPHKDNEHKVCVTYFIAKPGSKILLPCEADEWWRK